jgi:hypothetical protein
MPHRQCETRPAKQNRSARLRDGGGSSGTIPTMKTTHSRLDRARRLLRLVALVVVLGVGVYANGLRMAGKPWPQWMDGRYGGPLSWVMFATGLDCSVEVVAFVETEDGTVEVGRRGSYPGPSEWFWTVGDTWHQWATSAVDTMDWTAVEEYARRAAGVKEGEVRIMLRERRSSDSGGTAIRDLAPEDWRGACRQ